MLDAILERKKNQTWFKNTIVTIAYKCVKKVLKFLM